MSPGFALLLAFLGANILCAALIRFPWKKRQTGFVITHAGLLVLLAGSWYSLQHADEGQLGMLEGEVSSKLVRIDDPVIRVRELDPHTRQPVRETTIPFEPGSFPGARGRPGLAGSPRGSSTRPHWGCSTRRSREDHGEVLTGPGDPFQLVAKVHLPASMPTVEHVAAPDGVPMAKIHAHFKAPGKARAFRDLRRAERRSLVQAREAALSLRQGCQPRPLRLHVRRSAGDGRRLPLAPQGDGPRGGRALPISRQVGRGAEIRLAARRPGRQVDHPPRQRPDGHVRQGGADPDERDRAGEDAGRAGHPGRPLPGPQGGWPGGRPLRMGVVADGPQRDPVGRGRGREAQDGPRARRLLDLPRPRPQDERPVRAGRGDGHPRRIELLPRLRPGQGGHERGPHVGPDQARRGDHRVRRHPGTADDDHLRGRGIPPLGRGEGRLRPDGPPPGQDGTGDPRHARRDDRRRPHGRVLDPPLGHARRRSTSPSPSRPARTRSPTTRTARTSASSSSSTTSRSASTPAPSRRRASPARSA